MNAEKPFVVDSLLQLKQNRTFFKLNNFASKINLLLKLEGLNSAGSIKLKPAINMINALEKKCILSPGKNTIIESSSGSLGIALSLVCKIRGYRFICVTDPNINEVSKKYINLYGAKMIMVTERDENGGYLNTRIRLINKMLENDDSLIWLNQYASADNIAAHFNETASEIFNSFENIDYLFVGVGTSGTIMGCINYINYHQLKTKLIAVDAEGSVSFGFPTTKRLIPGIGTSRKPEILNTNLIEELILAPEQETIRMCRNILDQYGLLIGGSTGSVLYGVKQYMNKVDLSNKTIIVISPDFGDRYIDTIYNDDWVRTHFPDANIVASNS